MKEILKELTQTGHIEWQWCYEEAASSFSDWMTRQKQRDGQVLNITTKNWELWRTP